MLVAVKGKKSFVGTILFYINFIYLCVPVVHVEINHGGLSSMEVHVHFKRSVEILICGK